MLLHHFRQLLEVFKALAQQMVASGLCHSDLSVQNGTLPGIFPGCLGHEGAGIITQLGSNVQHLSVGDSVLLSFDYCGTCRGCRRNPAACAAWFPLNFSAKRKGDGRPSFAATESGERIAGLFFGQSSFSGHAIVAANSCIKVDPNLDLATLAPLGCGTQTGAGAVLNVLKPSKDSYLAVWGLGGVGIAALCAAKYLGVETIIAIDVVPERLSLAAELGATHCLNGKTDDIPGRISAITSGNMLDFTVEATGVMACLRQAYECLGQGGVHCQLGAFKMGQEAGIDINATQLLQKSFMGALEGNSNPPEFIPKLVAMWQDGYLPLEKFSKRYAIADFQAAIDAMKDGSVIKPILVF